MLQPSGFNWYFPGLYSCIVSFHDINDFYFSGHIANAAIFCYLLYGLSVRNPKSKLCRYAFRFWVCFKLPFIWTMMTVTRTHFVIDLSSGMAYFGISVIIGEILGYYVEVLVLGTPTKGRELYFYRPCTICGWSNLKPLLLIDNAEKNAQAHALGKTQTPRKKTSQTDLNQTDSSQTKSSQAKSVARKRQKTTNS